MLKSPVLQSVTLRPPYLKPVQFGDGGIIPFGPLQYSPSLLLDTQRVLGADSSIPICRVRRVTAGDEVDIYGYNPSDPRQYKTTSEAIGGLGSELFTNNTFDTDTDWTKQAGWTISGGAAHQSGVTSTIYQTPALTTGTLYQITFDITAYTSGELRPFIRGTTGTYVSGIGTYTQVVSAGVTAPVGLQTNAFIGSIDNVYIKEVIGGYYEPDENLLFPNEQFFVTTWYDQAWTTTTNQTINGWINSGGIPYETFTQSGDNITSAINTTGSGLAYSTDVFTPVVGDTYKATFDFVLNSGDSPRLGLGISGGTYSSNTINPTTGNNTAYFIASDATANQRLVFISTTAANFSLSNITLEKLDQNNAVQTTSANQPEVIWPGLTFGSEEVSSFTNNGTYPYETFTSSGTQITSAINTTGFGICSDSPTLTNGNKYKMEFNLTLNSGVVSIVGMSTAAVNSPANNYILAPPAGVNELYFEQVAGDSAFVFRNNNGVAVDFSTNNVSVKEVLTWDYPVVKFDGVDDYMGIANTTALQALMASGVFTVSARFSTSKINLYGGILSKSSGGGTTTVYFDYCVDITFPQLKTLVGDGVNYINAVTTQYLTENTFYNTVCTLDGSLISHYKDGSANGTPVGQTKDPASTTNNLFIGRMLNSGSYSFKGKMKTIQLYPTALNLSQITNLNNYYT